MKRLLTLAMLAMLVMTGCNPLDQTPVKVKIVTVWTQADYDKAAAGSGCIMHPHVVVERLDTGERIMIQRDTWGKTGDVFTIKGCNLHW